MRITALARRPVQATSLAGQLVTLTTTALTFVVALVAADHFPAGAQTLPPAPLPPTSNFNSTRQALAQAHESLQRANAPNSGAPASYVATVRANFLYAEALARYRMGDRATAVYDAALATGFANAALSGRTVIEPLAAYVPPAVVLRTIPVLPNELLRARDEIERVQWLTADPLSEVTASYRAALDRYFSGDVSGAKAGANAAYDLAEAALRAHNKH